MSTPRNDRHPDNMSDWMNQRIKREMHEARRPQITKASDLLGPGFGPFAIETRDWNSDAVAFNGFFFSEDGTGVLNSPDPEMIWLGLTIAAPHGHGVQQLFSHSMPVAGTPMRFIRTFHSTTTQIRTYAPWTELM